MKYKGLCGGEYTILGWKGNSLVTEHRGHKFNLTRKQTEVLLQSLGLKESDIPGYPHKKWEGWD